MKKNTHNGNVCFCCVSTVVCCVFLLILQQTRMLKIGPVAINLPFVGAVLRKRHTGQNVDGNEEDPSSASLGHNLTRQPIGSVKRDKIKDVSIRNFCQAIPGP